MPPPRFEPLEPRVLLDAVNFRPADTFNPPAGTYEELIGIEQVDLDDDGDLDLITFSTRWTQSESTALMRTRLNQGNGTFGSATETALSSSYQYNSVGGSAQGDFDGDGLLDIAVARGSDAGAWLLRGAANGTFASVTQVANIAPAGGASAGDVNGDGRDDLLVYGYSAGAKVYLGQADGTFSSAITLTTNPVAAGAIADFNEDGDADAVLGGDYGVQFLGVWTSNGDGTFQSPTQWVHYGNDMWNASSVESVSIADIDGDGNLDLLQRRYHLEFQGWWPRESRSFGVNFGNGSGSFGSYQTLHSTDYFDEPVAGPIAADLNGDGDLDFLWLGYYQVNYRINQGSRAFESLQSASPQNINLMGWTRRLVAGDYNSDGYDDLAASGNGVMQVFRVNPGVVRAGGPYNAIEGGSVVLQGVGDGTLEWDFDYDGTTFHIDATGAAPTFTAGNRDDGGVTIAVRGLNGAGQLTIATGTVNITDVAPTVTIDGDDEVEQGGTYTLHLSASDPGPDTIVGWIIDWGDGDTDEITGNPSSVTHTFSPYGQYTIHATAINNDGEFEADPLGVTVFESGPRAAILGLLATADEGDQLTLDAQVSNLAGGETLSYLWTITRNAVVLLSASTARLVFTPNDEGAYAVHLAVTIDGLLREAAKSVSVSNVAPQVEIAGLPAIAHVGKQITFVAQPSDPGDDTIAYGWAVYQGQALIASQASASPTFDWTPAGTGDFTVRVTINDGDGGSSFAEVVAAVVPALIILSTALYTPEDKPGGANVGTLTASHRDPARVLTWEILGGSGVSVFAVNAATGALRVADNVSLNFEAVASYTLHLRVSDDDDPALTASKTITVHVTDVNEAPVVTSATFTIPENRPNGTAVGTVSANDQDAGQAVTYAITAGNDAGVFAINASTGAISVADYTGLDFESHPAFHLTVAATDNAAAPLAGNATITIELIDRPDTPVAIDDVYTISHDRTLGITSAAAGVLTNDVKIGADAASATLVTDVAHGSLALQSNGTFTYTPGAGFVGDVAFEYRVNQPGLTGSTALVTIHVINRAPTAADVPYTVPHDVALIISGVPQGLLASARDADADALIASLYGDPQHGDVIVTSDGTFIYTPDEGYVGVDSFQYRVSDGLLWSDPRTVTIGVTNAAPVALADVYRVTADALFAASSARGILWNDLDHESDSLAAQLVSAPAHGEITLAADGSFIYTPDAGYVGIDSFVYLTTDGRRSSDVATVVLQVVAPPPPAAVGHVYRVQHSQTLEVGEPELGVLRGVINQTGLTLSAVLVAGPAHGQLTLNADGTFTYVANPAFVGTDTFTFLADAPGLQGPTATIELIVGNAAPLAYDAHYYATHGKPILITDPALGLLAYTFDPDGDPITAHSVSTPGIGHLFAFNADGTFHYVPTFNDARTVTFTWKAGDGLAYGPTRTIYLHFTTAAPAPVSDFYLYAAGQPLAVTAQHGVLVNDYDADDDALTAHLLTQPATGAVTLNANGSFVYTPASGAGPHELITFTYEVTDGVFTSGPVSVALVSSDSVPVGFEDRYDTLHGIPLAKSADEGVLVNDIDAEDDALAAMLIDGPQHGTVTLDADGGFLYVPAAGFVGIDEFTYAAWDASGASAPVRVLITVVDTPPVAMDDAYFVSAGTTLTASALHGVLANDADGDGDTLTASILVQAAHGTAALHANGSFVYTPNLGFVGADSFTYRVFDGALWSDPATVNLVVVNTAPIAVEDAYLASHDRTLTIAPAEGVLANDFDLDEAATLAAVLLRGPDRGTLALNADGSFSYSPSAGFVGVDAFVYAASDGASQSAPVRVTLIVGNTPANGVDDEYQVSEDATLTVAAPAGVLVNDGDDEDDALTASLHLAPSFGGITLASDGAFIYVPDADFFGVDSFVYRVTDGLSESYATVVVVVTPVNDAPESQPIHLEAHVNRPLAGPAGALFEGAADADGDMLIAAALSQPAHGTLTVNANGSFVYTPAAGYLGDDEFTITISDGVAAPVAVSVTVCVTNATPVASPLSITVLPDVATTLPAPSGLVFVSRDADGDALTALLVVGSGPTHGTLTLNADGSFVYTPNAAYTGPDAFSYTVTDGFATSDPASVSILVTSNSIIAQRDTYSVVHDRTLTIGTRWGVLWNDWEPAGAAITAELITGALHGEIELSANGEFVYTPVSGFVGSDTFTYRAVSGSLVSDVATVTIHVTNTSPVATPDAYRVIHDRELDVDAAHGLLVGDYDDDGDSLVAALTEGFGPAHGTVVIDGNGSFIYAPDAGYVGEDTFWYTVTDGIVTSDRRRVDITVTNRDIAAADLEFRVHHGGTLEDRLFESDTDADGDTLSVVLVESPEHGQIVFDGVSFEYTPNVGFVGVDSFAYRVSDGVSVTTAVVATIDVWNHVPYAVGESHTIRHRERLVLNHLLDNDFDLDGDEIFVVWGPGPVNGQRVAVAGSSDQVFEYVPNAGYVGIDTIFYYVSDGLQMSQAVAVSIEVINEAPLAMPDIALTQPGTAVAIDVSANDTDADGDELAVAIAAQPGHGSATVGQGGVITYTPTAGFTGNDFFYYTVSDGSRVSVPTCVAVTVGTTYLIVMPDSYWFIGGGTRNVATAEGVLANDLADTGEGGVSAVLTARLLNGTQHGTLTLDADGGFTYTPALGFVGADHFTYEAGANGAWVSGRVTLYVGVTPIVVADDEYVLLPGASLNANVLVNDYGAIGAMLLPGPDAHVVGAFSLDLDGSFRYTPASNYVGTAEFTYSVGQGVQPSTATIRVHVISLPPTGDGKDWTDRASPMTVGTLIAGVNSYGGSVAAESFLIYADPRFGSLSLSDQTPAASTQITYVPRNGATEEDVFYFTVANSHGVRSMPIKVTIGAGSFSQPPVLVGDESTVLQGQSVEIAVFENDRLPIDVIPAAVIVSAPAHGTATVSPDGSKIIYAASGSFSGDVTFTYQMAPSSGGESGAVATVTVSVGKVNHAPVAVPDAISVNSGETVAVAFNQLTGNDTDADDPNGMLVVYGFEITRQPLAGTIAYGTAEQNSNGFVYAAPFVQSVTTDSFEYHVRDRDGEWATGVVSVTITPFNHAPYAKVDYFVKPYNTSYNPTFYASINVVANDRDADGDDLTIDAFEYAGSDFASLSADRKSIILAARSEGVPQGQPYFPAIGRIWYRITDGRGGSSTATLFVNEASETYPPEQVTINPGQTYQDYTRDVKIRNLGEHIIATIGTHSVSVAPLNPGGNYYFDVAGNDIDFSYNPFDVSVEWTGDANSLFITASGDVGSISIAGDLAVTSVRGSIGNLAGRTVAATAFGDIGTVTATTRVHTITSQYGSVGFVTAQDGRVGGVGATHGTIAGASATEDVAWVGGGRIVGPIHAGTFIDSIESKWGSIEGVIEAGTYIRRIYSALDILSPTITVGGNLGEFSDYLPYNMPGVVARRSIHSNIRAGGHISGITAIAGEITGSITAGYLTSAGHIGSVTTQRGDIRAAISAKSIIYVIGAAIDFVGSVRASVIGTVSAGGSIDAEINASAAEVNSVSYSLNVAAGLDISGTIRAFGVINQVAAGRAIKNIVIESMSASITEVVAGNHQLATSSGLIENATIVAQVNIVSVSARAGTGHGGTMSSVVIEARTGAITDIWATGALSALIKAKGWIGPVQAGVTGPGDLDVEIESADAGVRVLRSLRGDVRATVRVHTDAGSQPATYWHDPLLWARGSFTADFQVKGSVASIEALHGSILGVILADGGIGALKAGRDVDAVVISRSGTIGNVTARRHIQGSLTAHGNVGNISAGRDVGAAITSVSGGIGTVTAGAKLDNPFPSRGSITGNIAAARSIGAITANGSLTTDTAATPFGILRGDTPGDEVLSRILTQLSTSPYLLNSPSLTSILNQLRAFTIEPMVPGAAGLITGAISAGGSIASVVAGGSINSTISAAGSIGTIWSRGDVRGAITSGIGILTIDAWGEIDAAVSGKNAITLSAIGALRSSVSATNADVLVQSVGDVTLPYLLAFDAIVRTLGTVEIVRAIVTERLAVRAIGSLTFDDSDAKAFVAATFGELRGALGSGLSTAKNAVFYAWDKASLFLNKDFGSLIIYTHGDVEIDTDDMDRVVKGAFILSGGSITYRGPPGSRILSDGDVFLQALGDIKVNVTSMEASYASSTNSPPGAPAKMNTLQVDGRNVEGTFVGKFVGVTASENFKGQVVAVEHAQVTAGGDIEAGIYSAGTAIVSAGGDILHHAAASPVTMPRSSPPQPDPQGQTPAPTPINSAALGATIEGVFGVVIEAWGKLRATVASPKGFVHISADDGIDIAQTLSASLDAAPHGAYSVLSAALLDIESMGEVKGVFRSGGYIRAISASDIIDSIFVSYREIAVDTWGDFTGVIRSIKKPGSSSEDDAVVVLNAHGSVVAEIGAPGDVLVSVAGDLDGVITSTNGGVTAYAIGSVKSPITAKRDISITTNSVQLADGAIRSTDLPPTTPSGVIKSTQGNVGIQAFGDVKAFIQAASGVQVIAGRFADVHASTSVDSAVVAVTALHSQSISIGTLPVNGANQSFVSVASPNGEVVISVSGDLGVYIIGATETGGVNGIPTNVDIFAAGHALGRFGAKQNASILSFESINAITGYTTGAHGTLSVATDGDLTGDFTAGDALDAYASGRILNGRFLAGQNAAAHAGNAKVAAMGAILGVVISTRITNYETPTIPGNPLLGITPSSVPAELGAEWRNIRVTAGGELSQVTATATRSVYLLVGADVNNSTIVSAAVDAAVSAPRGMIGDSVQVYAGGTASLAARDNFSASVHAGSADIYSPSQVTVQSVVTTTGDLSVFAGAGASGTFTSARDLAITAALLDGTLTAGRDAYVLSSSTVAGSVSAQGFADIRAVAEISASITAGSLALEAFSDVTGPVTVTTGDAAIIIAGDLTGTVVVQGDLGMTVIGDAQAPISADGNAEITVRGNLGAPLTIGGSLTLMLVGKLDAAVSAGVDASVTVAYDVASSVHAGRDLQLIAIGDINAIASAGRDLRVTAFSDLTAGVTAGRHATLTVLGDFTGGFTVGGDAAISVAGYLSSNLDIGGNAAIAAGDVAAVTGIVDANLSISAASNLIALLDVGGDASFSIAGPLTNLNVTAGGGLDVFTLSVSAHLDLNAHNDVTLFTLHSATADVVSHAGSIEATFAESATLDAAAALDIHVTAWDSLNATLFGGAFVYVTAIGSVVADIHATHDIVLVTGAGLTSNELEAGGSIDISAFGHIIVTGDPILAGNSVSLSSFDTITADIDVGGDISIAARGNVAGEFHAGNDATLITFGSIYQVVLTAGRDIVRVFAAQSITASSFAAAQHIERVSAIGDIQAGFTAGDRIISIISYASILTGTTMTAGVAEPQSEYDHSSSPFWGWIERVIAWGAIDAVFVTPGVVSNLLAAGAINADFTGVDGEAAGGGPVADMQSFNRYLLTSMPVVTPPSSAAFIAGLRVAIREFQATLDELESTPGFAGHAASSPGNSTLGPAHEARERFRRQADEQLRDAGDVVAASVQHRGFELLLQVTRAMQSGDRELRAVASMVDTQRSDSANAFLRHREALVNEREQRRRDLIEAGRLTLKNQADRASEVARLRNEKADHKAIAESTFLTTVASTKRKDFAELGAEFMAMVNEHKAALQADREGWWKPILDWTQSILDVLSFIPGVGGFADLLNGLIYYFRGNYGMMAISFAAGMGQLGTWVGGSVLKVSLKGAAKATGALTKIATRAGRWIATALHASEFLSSKVGMWVTKAWQTMRNGVVWAGEKLHAIRSVFCPYVENVPILNRFFCFAEGTQVVVGVNADGTLITRNIEDLKPGDLVLSRDEFEATGRVEFKPIVVTSEKTSDHLRVMTLVDDAGNIQTIRTTDEHPFYVAGIAGGGWTNAKDLEGGQQLATADSTRTLTVLSSNREEHATGVKVYNFTVADNHTYFVTDAPTRGPPAAVWVHNQPCTPASLLTTSRGGRAAKKYSVYKGFDEAGNLVYVGITKDVGRRAIEHAARFDVPGAIIGNLTKRQARAIEQALITKYGISKHGGQLLNEINSIASNRKWFADAKSWGNAMVKLKGW